MKRFIIPVILLALIGLQNSIFEYIRIVGVKPDIVLTFIICYTLVRGNPLGTAVGVFGGITEDIFFGDAFGINSIAIMITAYFIGFFEDKIYKDNIFVPGIFTFVGTLIKEMIVFLFMYLTRASMDISVVLMNIIIPEAIYNSVLSAILFRYVAKLCDRVLIEQNWKF